MSILNVTGSEFQYYVIVDDAGNASAFFPLMRNIPDDIRPPLAAGAVEITEDQWHNWMENPAQRLVDGKLVAAPPTVQQQAVALLSNPVVTVESASIPALDGDYSASDSSRGNITGIAVAINGGLGLPSGGETFNYPDVTGTPHPWPADQFVLLAHGVMVYVYNLSQAASGQSTSLPSATITI